MRAARERHFGGPGSSAKRRLRPGRNLVRRARDQVSERRPLEHVAHRRSWSSQRGCSAAAAPGTRPPPARAAHRRDRPLDRSDDVGDADRLGRPRQRVAALDAALARNQLLVAQLEEDRLQELPRDRLRGRELLGLDEPAGGGQLGIARRA